MIFSALALMSLLVSYTLGIGDVCIGDHHCPPNEKCIRTSTSKLKKCVILGPVSPWPTDQKPCTRNRDCDIWRLELCIHGSCMTLKEYFEK